MESRKTIQVIDNYLPKDKFEYIKNIFFDSENNFPWYFNDFIADKKDNSDFYFSHYLYDHNTIISSFFEKIVPILNQQKLYRAKCNLYTKKQERIYTKYHIDLPYPHMVMLYNINTNNGFTSFEDGTEICSKENQVILFNGEIKHRSVSQTDERVRININIDYGI